MLGLAITYRLVFTAVGGHVAARLAPFAPMQHVLALVAVGTLLGLVGASAAVGITPTWYTILVIVLTPVPLGSAGLAQRIDSPVGAISRQRDRRRPLSATPATAEAFLAELLLLDQSTSGGEAAAPQRAGASGRAPMRAIFALAKRYIDMTPVEIGILLDRPEHEARIGAVSIMDFQARRASTSTQRRRELYELYIRRHDRIDNWDLVDRSAPHVVGGYLSDKPRGQLYTLARSDSQWERRTAIVATYYFIRQGDLDDTFAIAEILISDEADLVRKAVGGWIREAGKRDRDRLLAFLNRHAATMPRTTLRYAIEHLTPDEKRRYMDARSTSAPSGPTREH